MTYEFAVIEKGNESKEQVILFQSPDFEEFMNYIATTLKDKVQSERKTI